MSCVNTETVNYIGYRHTRDSESSHCLVQPSYVCLANEVG